VPVRIIPFAGARDAIGAPEVDLEVPDATPAPVLLDLVCERFPALRSRRPFLKLAVNGVWADASTVVSSGDEVALLPPVSGG